MMITRRNSGTCLNIYMVMLVSVALGGLDDGREFGTVMGWRTQPCVCACVHASRRSRGGSGREEQ